MHLWLETLKCGDMLNDLAIDRRDRMEGSRMISSGSG